MNRARAVIFDFDGVIAASEPFHYQAVYETIAQLGVVITPDQYREKYLHLGDREGLEGILNDHNHFPAPNDLDHLLAHKHQIFSRFRDEGLIALCDGFEELLRGLFAAGVPVGLCSAGAAHDIFSVLDHHVIRSLFRCVVTIEDVQKGKPDPAGYLLTVEHLRLHCEGALLPEEVIAVEDSPGGLAAALAAGLRTVGVCTSYPATALGDAHRIFTTLAGLAPDDLLAVAGES